MSPETESLITDALQRDVKEGATWPEVRQHMNALIGRLTEVTVNCQIEEACELAYNKGAFDADPAVNPDNLPGPSADLTHEAVDRR